MVFQTERSNFIVVLFFFCAAFAILNRGGNDVGSHAIGICCIIAGLYGSVCLWKNVPFIFKPKDLKTIPRSKTNKFQRHYGTRRRN